MPREEDFTFSFTSGGLPEDTFMVAEFKGVEGLSMLYEFEIVLYSLDPEIDLKTVLQNPATLTIIPEGEEERKIHGIPASLEQLHELDEFTYYRLRLVPRLWLADQHHENMLFLDKKVPEVLEEILKQVGLTTQDYELKLTGTYQPWEYICQYNETDFDFISRWMEREGIYYYFDQSGDYEKLVITDSSTAHQPIEGDSVIYSPPHQPAPSVFEQVQEFTCRQQILPKKVVLKDYNYRKPSLDLKGEADVDTEGRGNVYIYGEHFKTPEEGNALAKIRAEELLCREQLFYGVSTVSPFLSGYLFELDEHYRDSYNQKYLLTEVTHQGVQAEAFAMTGRIERITNLEEPGYENSFSCIPAAPQFRPERKTLKPRIDGTLNAKVDASGDGQYAEIDDEGRYKVKLPFDQSDASDGKASRYVRMAQPYAGADYGMHFPLHKGIEVLLTFIDGDPDRPIISGSIPNPETSSPINSSSNTKSMMRTAAQNEIMLEDQQGAEMILLKTPNSNSQLYMGATASTNGIRATTDGHGVLHAKKGIYLNAWPTDYWSTGNASQYINACVTAASTVGAAAVAAGAGNLAAIPAVLGTAAAVGNVAAPGIVMSSPAGISAITPSTFTAASLAGIGLFTPATADVVGLTSASLMGGAGVNIFTSGGGIRCVAAGGDLDLHAKKKDIKASALNNITVEAKTGDLSETAGKNITLEAKDDDIVCTAGKNIKLNAKADDIRATAKKNLVLTAETNNISINAKQELDLVSDSNDISIEALSKKVEISAKQDLVAGSDKEIKLACGSASITLKSNGRIDIKGTTINVQASSGSLYLKAPNFELAGSVGGKVTAAKLDVKATAVNTITGNPVMIN